VLVSRWAFFVWQTKAHLDQRPRYLAALGIGVGEDGVLQQHSQADLQCGDLFLGQQSGQRLALHALTSKSPGIGSPAKSQMTVRSLGSA
jgi:hypothetical protein